MSASALPLTARVAGPPRPRHAGTRSPSPPSSHTRRARLPPTHAHTPRARGLSLPDTGADPRQPCALRAALLAGQPARHLLDRLPHGPAGAPRPSPPPSRAHAPTASHHRALAPPLRCRRRSSRCSSRSASTPPPSTSVRAPVTPRRESRLQTPADRTRVSHPPPPPPAPDQAPSSRLSSRPSCCACARSGGHGRRGGDTRVR